MKFERRTPFKRQNIRPIENVFGLSSSQFLKLLNRNHLSRHRKITYPKLEMLALFDWKPFGQGIVSLWILTFHAVSCIAGFRLFKPQTPGIIPASVIRAAFMIAKIPLAASLCPMFALIAPNSNGLSFPLVSFMAFETA